MTLKAVSELVQARLLVDEFRPCGSRQWKRQRDDLIAIVQLQVSRSNETFTVNLGLILPALAEFEEGPEWKRLIAEPDSWHWRLRLGHCLPIPTDKWWHLDDPADSVDLVESLVSHGLPVLDRFTDASVLRQLWEHGEGPGLTALVRDRLLRSPAWGE